MVALLGVAVPSIASAADWQLHQIDGDVYWDAATMDANYNGCLEQTWYDADNDNAWDTHFFDRGGGDCFTEAVTFDLDENGVPEYMLLDIDQRVGYEWLYFDTDQDGRWNFRRIVPRSTLDARTRLNNLNATREQLRAFSYRTGQSIRFATYPIL
jgi:hypothetical protein